MIDYEYLKSLNMADEPIFDNDNTCVNFELEGSFYILDSEQFFKLFEDKYNEQIKSEMDGLSLKEVMEDENIYAVTDIYVDANKNGEMVMSVVLAIEDDRLDAVVELDKTALEVLRDKIVLEMENIKKEISTNEQRAENREGKDSDIVKDLKETNDSMRKCMDTFIENANSFINGKFAKDNEEQEIDR